MTKKLSRIETCFLSSEKGSRRRVPLLAGLAVFVGQGEFLIP